MIEEDPYKEIERLKKIIEAQDEELSNTRKVNNKFCRNIRYYIRKYTNISEKFLEENKDKPQQWHWSDDVVFDLSYASVKGLTLKELKHATANTNTD